MTDCPACARRFVIQTKLHDPVNGVNGNCFASCLATLLGVSVRKIPQFEDMMEQHEWGRELNRWLFSKRLALVRVEGDIRMPFPYLAVGPSPRFPDERHCVVHEAGQLLHDPYPGGRGIAEVEFSQMLFSLGEVIDEIRASC